MLKNYMKKKIDTIISVNAEKKCLIGDREKFSPIIANVEGVMKLGISCIQNTVRNNHAQKSDNKH